MDKIITKTKKYLSTGLGYLCAALLVLMTVIVLWEVICGWIKIQANWVNELVKISLVWVAFAGAAYALLTREHMSLTLFRDKFKGKAFKIVMIIIDALVLFVVTLIAIGGFIWISTTLKGQVSNVLNVPLFIYYFIVPISSLIMMLAQVISLVEDITGKKFKEVVEQ